MTLLVLSSRRGVYCWTWAKSRDVPRVAGQMAWAHGRKLMVYDGARWMER